LLHPAMLFGLGRKMFAVKGGIKEKRVSEK